MEKIQKYSINPETQNPTLRHGERLPESYKLPPPEELRAGYDSLTPIRISPFRHKEEMRNLAGVIILNNLSKNQE